MRALLIRDRLRTLVGIGNQNETGFEGDSDWRARGGTLVEAVET